MIAIVDTGGANISSVIYAIERLGHAYKLTKDPVVIKSARRVLLPGVGAAGDSMSRLQQSELCGTIRELERPTLGICLGMQLLFESSEEGNAECLGILPGHVFRMKESPEVTIPHMGWNRLEWSGEPSLLKGLDQGCQVYFVHSYQAPVNASTVATTSHGAKVPAIVNKDFFWGCQFHPERSGKVGARILENFLK